MLGDREGDLEFGLVVREASEQLESRSKEYSGFSSATDFGSGRSLGFGRLDEDTGRLGSAAAVTTAAATALRRLESEGAVAAVGGVDDVEVGRSGDRARAPAIMKSIDIFIL